MVVSVFLDIKNGKSAEGVIDAVSKFGVNVEAGRDLSKLRTRKFNDYLLIDPTEKISKYDLREILGFSSRYGGILINFSFADYDDFSEVKDTEVRYGSYDLNAWHGLFDATLSRESWNPLLFYFNIGHREAEIATEDGSKHKIWYIPIPRKYVTIQSAFAVKSPCNLPETQLKIGDDEREEVELFEVSSDGATPLLKRKIILSEELYSPQMLQQLLSSSIPQGKVLTKKSVEYLQNVLRYDFNVNQAVGVLSTKAETIFEEEFPGSKPRGERIATCGWLCEDMYAEQNAKIIALMLAHIARRTGGKLERKVTYETPPIQEELELTEKKRIVPFRV